jgi:hypothetical protein
VLAAADRESADDDEQAKAQEHQAEEGADHPAGGLELLIVDVQRPQHEQPQHSRPAADREDQPSLSARHQVDHRGIT